LERLNNSKVSGHVPGFDEYELSFNVCDLYNRMMHDKSWPHRYSGKGYSSEYQAGSDYLFTVAILNMWNYWRALDFASRSQLSYEEFRTQLAVLICNSNFIVDDEDGSDE
jgi:hypothetical protein